MQDPKNRHLRAIVQICRAISSQLRHTSTIEKNLLSSNISSTCPHIQPTSGWDHFVSLRHACKFQRVTQLGSVTARHFSIGGQLNFAALNRGRHLYSAGQPSRWALAHISSLVNFGWFWVVVVLNDAKSKNIAAVEFYIVLKHLTCTKIRSVYTLQALVKLWITFSPLRCDFCSNGKSVPWRWWLGGRKGIRPVRNMGEWWRWALVSPDGVAPSRMVGVSASVNIPLHHKVQKFSSGTGSPGWSRRKRAVKRLCVCAANYNFVSVMVSELLALCACLICCRFRCISTSNISVQ